MLKIIKTQIRPSIDIPFFYQSKFVNPKYGEHLKTNYLDTGKLIKIERSISDDQLTTTIVMEWKSQKDLLEYMNDEFCIENFLKISTEYEHLHNIVSKMSFDTEPFEPTWKQISAKEYFKDIEIPEDWNSLEDFVDWYCSQKMPLMIPWNAEVIRSDDAVAVCIFRKGHYQVEFYLEYPYMFIHKHSHPRMEVITMNLGGGGNWEPSLDLKNNVSSNWGSINTKLSNQAYHGGEENVTTGKGFVTLAFQRWENIEEMTSAAIQWKGLLQGNLQAELIKRHYPDAYIKNGYADITLKNSDIPTVLK